MWIPLSYNVRSLLVRKTTTIATALGIGLVVFVLASALMLSAGIRHTLIAGGEPDGAIVIRKGSDAELPSSIETKDMALVLAAPGVRRGANNQTVGTGEVVAVIAQERAGATDGQVTNVLVRGVQDNVFAVRPGVKIVEGRPAKPGTDEVVVGRALLGRFRGIELGQSFELKRNRPVQVVGVFDAGGTSFDSEVWADLNVVQNAFGREGLVSSVTVRLESPEKFDAFRAAVESDKRLGLEALRERDYFEKVSEGTSIFITAMGIIVALFFSVGAMIGAMITMYGAVSQRSREVGTLRALGFPRIAVLASFLFEAVFLAAVGGAVGALAASAMSFVSIGMMNWATWQEVIIRFDPTPGILAVSVLVGGVMGLVGGLFPAIRAARTSPIAAMRD